MSDGDTPEDRFERAGKAIRKLLVGSAFAGLVLLGWKGVGPETRHATKVNVVFDRPGVELLIVAAFTGAAVIFSPYKTVDRPAELRRRGERTDAAVRRMEERSLRDRPAGGERG